MTCPSESHIVDFIEGRAREPVRDQVVNHLDECPNCRMLVARAAEALLEVQDTIVDQYPVLEAEPLALQPGDPLGRYVILHYV